MAEPADTATGAPQEPRPGVTLGDSLVTARLRSTGPLPARALRLDRESISCIGKLRGLAQIHSLYLQQNQIEKIENLESFPNLRFLCLAGNRIQRVENLRVLPQLGALDLSHNLIQVLDTEELPRSLRVLDLAGNGCTRQDGYRDRLVAALPRLLQLDSQPVRAKAEEAAGGGSRSSEEEEEEEDEEEEDEELLPGPRIPFTADRDFLADLRRELAGRARRRRTENLQEHRERLQELRERRALLLGAAQDGAAAAPGTPGARPPPLPPSRGAQPAPDTVLPPGRALQEDTRAGGAGNGQLSQISCSGRRE